MHWMLSYTVNHTARADTRGTASRSLAETDSEESNPEEHDHHHVEHHGTDDEKASESDE